MKQMLLFFGIVFIGVFGVIFISNYESRPKTATPILPQISPQQNTTTTPPASNPTEQQSNLSEAKAVIKTSKGDIKLSFFSNEAPKTVENFLNKAKSGFYNNLTFHRVEDWVVQGGDSNGDGTGGGNMPVEFNSKPFVIGSLGIASRGDGKNQNDAQFFITKSDASWLNGQYTNFGQVTKGMDVVSKIQIGDKILGITME